MTVNPAPSRRQQTQNAALFGAALLLPALFALYLALTAGRLPVRDYWPIMQGVYLADGFSTNLADWLAPQNGHIVFIPRLIYTLNILIAQGSNLGLTITAWLLALLQALLLVQLIPKSLADRRVRLLAVATISVFSFAPSATDNWMHGFSGVHWILVNVFAIGAFLGLTNFFRQNSVVWLIGGLLSAGLGLLTHGTALAAWPTLATAFVFMRARVRVGVAVAGVVTLVLVWAALSRPAVVPSSLTLLDRAIVFGPYLAVFMGGAFTLNIPAAFAIGLLGLAAAGLVLVRYGLLSPPKTRLGALPWLLMIVYGLVFATMIAASRLEFGLGYATSQRYVTVSGVFWIALLMLLALWIYGSRSSAQLSWTALAPYGFLILFLFIAMLPLGLERAQRWRRQISLQPTALLSIDLGIPDRRAVEVAIVVVPDSFLDQVPLLKEDGLVPFDEPRPDRCGQPGERLPQHLLEAPPAVMAGEFEFIDPIIDRGFRSVGRLRIDPELVDCIVLANQDEIIKGKALPGFNYPDGNDVNRSGWIGYVRLDAPDEQITAYVRLIDSSTWIPLAHSRSRIDTGQPRPKVYVNIVGYQTDRYIGLENFNNFLSTFGYSPPVSDANIGLNQ